VHMTYLIENEIVFNPEDNSLSLLRDSESKVTVSNPARRILLLLIEQQGIVVLRETFFKKVWDDYGLTASNNNLNHCISKLRKVISTLGYDNELITTVPKAGFIISKGVIIESISGDYLIPKEIQTSDDAISKAPGVFPAAQAETALSGEVINTGAMPEGKIPEAQDQKRKANYYLIISILVTGALTVWALFVLYNDLADPKAELKIARIGDCDLYSTSPVISSQKRDFAHLAETYLQKKKIICRPGDIFIFQSERFSLPINTGSVRDFIAQCSTDDDHKINVCISYYANDRTTHDR